MEQPTCLIDDFGPLPVLRPASVEELRGLVMRAAADSKAVYPLGGRTQLDLGLPPQKNGVCLDLRELCHVIDYPARDMTITVGAGISVAHLGEILAAEGQRLPIDVPRRAEATLGGVLATNTSGPRRYGFGTVRDYVIGISVVNDRGEETKAGGRVVKNVAGYDLCKLHVGALGTLGIITQVTLKLRPLPEEHALLILGCPGEGLTSLLDLLHESRTRPVCLDLLNPAAARLLNQAGAALPDSDWVLLAGYEGSREAVTWQLQQLVREMGASHSLNARVGAAAAPLWQALAGLPAGSPATLSFKANLRPSACGRFCQEASQLAADLLLQAHAGNGIVLGHLPPDLEEDRAANLVAALRTLAAASQGQVVLCRCPVKWKQRLAVWGPPRGDTWLMREVKQQLDPGRIFNPGRFVDAL